MITQFIIYDNNGQILRKGSAPEDMLLIQKNINENILEGFTADDNTQYILNNTVTDKVSMETSINKATVIANSIDTIVISNIPNDAELLINNESIEIITDGTAELTFDAVGEYSVKLDVFPYLEQEYIINAN